MVEVKRNSSLYENLYAECSHISCPQQKGVQVYRKPLSITVLVRDEFDIHWYYHIAESEIPVRQSDTDVVTEFVKSLLILRNVLNVNMSLLFSTH